MRVFKYLNGTRKYHLTLIVDEMVVIKSYVEASFEVHPYFKSHTSGIMMWGIGEIQYGLTKQKLNTRSNVEAEFVSVNNMASNIFGQIVY